MKKTSVILGYTGTQICGDYFINHEIRIPFLSNQDSMESMVRRFFFVAHLEQGFSLPDQRLGDALFLSVKFCRDLVPMKFGSFTPRLIHISGSVVIVNNMDVTFRIP